MLAIPALRCDEARKLKITDFRFKELRSKKSYKEFIIMYLLQAIGDDAPLLEDPQSAKKFINSKLKITLQNLTENLNKEKEERVKLYYIFVKGKGNKTRTVPIPKEFYHEVKEYFKIYRRSSDYIFDNGFGVPLSTNHFRKLCKETARKANVSSRFSPHAARRWRAAFLWRSGVKLDTISRYLGHSDPSITVKHYLDMLKDYDHFQEITDKDPLFGLSEVVIKDPTFSENFDKKSGNLEVISSIHKN